jgi:CheY-like chemotaxis protein
MRQPNGFILLVDDSEVDVEITLRALKDAGVANPVTVIADGADALDFLLRRGVFTGRPGGNPILILMDVKMPRLDGIETLNEIRCVESLDSIPVVMLTSSREDTDLLKSYKFGANAYVIKPVDYDEFTKTINAINLFWIVTNQPPP